MDQIEGAAAGEGNNHKDLWQLLFSFLGTQYEASYVKWFWQEWCRIQSSHSYQNGDIFHMTGVKRPRENSFKYQPVLTGDDLSSHLSDLRSAQYRYKVLMTILLRRLMEHRTNRGVFNSPVDYVKLGLATYPAIVKQPMDLGTIKENVTNDKYMDLTGFVNDVRLVFENAKLFNPKSHYIYKAAVTLLKSFEKDLAKFMQQIKSTESEREKHSCSSCKGSICTLCFRRCLEFKRPILRCSSPCNAKIQRNHVYYRAGGDRGQHWCSKCYGALPESFIGILGQRIEKTSLEKLRNDEVVVEPWVECAVCRKRMHQICALYNPLIKRKAFACIVCLVEVQNSSPERYIAFLPVEEAPMRIRDLEGLPQTLMGSYLEERIKVFALRRLTEEDKLAEIKAKEIVGSLTLRVISSRKRITHIEPRLNRWIEAQRISCGKDLNQQNLKFEHHAKTILIFQTIDGVDVLLFVLYVQEYNNSCAKPNQSKVYISYLDSVGYMKPRSIRTVVYQQTMVGYILWVQARGFKDMYIWACPPKREDAYIIYCHPKWQRTPSAERLRKWYATIFDWCLREGRIISTSNMYDVHFSSFRPLVNTRSSLDNDTITTDFNITEIRKPVESIPYFYGDYIPNEIESMLAALSRLKVGVSQSDEAIFKWWEAVWGKTAKARLVNSPVNNYDLDHHKNVQEKICAIFGNFRPNCFWKFEPKIPVESIKVNEGSLTPNQRNEWMMRKLAGSIKPMRENFLVLEMNRKDGKENMNHARKVDGVQDTNKSPESYQVLDSRLKELIPDTSDPDPLLPQGIFDTRLFLLDFCQDNHLQFDELRRAKHSTMILLYAIKYSLKYHDWKS